VIDTFLHDPAKDGMISNQRNCVSTQPRPELNVTQRCRMQLLPASAAVQLHDGQLVAN